MGKIQNIFRSKIELTFRKQYQSKDGDIVKKKKKKEKEIRILNHLQQLHIQLSRRATSKQKGEQDETNRNINKLKKATKPSKPSIQSPHFR